MNREDLIKRIEAVNQKIEKAIKNRDKYLNKISDENKKYADIEKYSYTDVKKLSLSYDEEVNIDSCRTKNSEIKSLTNTLNNYKEKLNKLDDFENQVKVKVIWDFLLRWKEDVFNFIKENAQELYSLKTNYQEAFEKYKSEHPEDFNGHNWRQEYYKEKEFGQIYYASIHRLTYEVYIRKGEVDEKRLNAILDRDIEAKYKNLENKIKKVCGDIVDASDLHIASNGMINGYIIGTEGKAYVETIVAGGYNQNIIVNSKHGQIAHYRVLVKKVK